MNNTIILAVKYCVLIGVAFFSFASVSFATNVLTPASVSGVSETRATLSSVLTSDGWNNTSVWFEWGETSSLEKGAIGLMTIPYQGMFHAILSNLTPGKTYYFHAVAMDQNGNKTISPTATFTTNSPASAVTVTTVMSGSDTTQTAVSSQAQKDVAGATTAATKKVSATTAKTSEKSSSKEAGSVSNDNTNIASVIGVGNGVLPSTLIGWLLLFIAILVAVILAHMIYESNEKRKKAIAQKKLKEATPATA